MPIPEDFPRTVLVGTGVVGRAILNAHILANVSVCVTDQNAEALRSSVDSLRLDTNTWQIETRTIDDADLVAIVHSQEQAPAEPPILVIESIAERLDVKQAFFQKAERVFGDEAVLCSNTSTLRIEAIAEGMRRPQRVCGMHFFMPVDQRTAVEVVKTENSSDRIIAACVDHVERINKTPMVVRDSPGFLVNRLLSPYLNQSLLLLAHGVTADQIERAAKRYGMPISPLELIDWIGTRTMFDAGRAFWQAFPNRIDPSPIVPALLKKKRGGRAGAAGLYNYVDGERSAQLASTTTEIVKRYQLDPLQLTDDDIMHLLAIPMRIEAHLARNGQVADSDKVFDTAMSGGLGYQSNPGWLAFFRSLGDKTINEAIRKWSPLFKSMRLDLPAS